MPSNQCNIHRKSLVKKQKLGSDTLILDFEKISQDLKSSCLIQKLLFFPTQNFSRDNILLESNFDEIRPISTHKLIPLSLET